MGGRVCVIRAGGQPPSRWSLGRGAEAFPALNSGGSPGRISAEAEDGRASFWSLKLCCGLVSTWLSVFPFSKERKVSVTVTEGLGEETRTADPTFVAHPGAEEGQGVPSPADCAGAQAAGDWRHGRGALAPPTGLCRAGACAAGASEGWVGRHCLRG